MACEDATGEESLQIRVAAVEDAATARERTRALAEANGFGEQWARDLAGSVNELANNLAFHADGGGTVTVRLLRRADRTGVEVTVEDEGPGIPDVSRAMELGFSTAGGLGAGLPLARKLVDEFEIHSAVPTGTRIVARKWNRLADS